MPLNLKKIKKIKKSFKLCKSRPWRTFEFCDQVSTKSQRKQNIFLSKNQLDYCLANLTDFLKGYFYCKYDQSTLQGIKVRLNMIYCIVKIDYITKIVISSFGLVICTLGASYYKMNCKLQQLAIPCHYITPCTNL